MLINLEIRKLVGNIEHLQIDELHVTWVWRYGGGLKDSQLHRFCQLHPQPDHLITRLQPLATLPVLQAALAVIE